MTIAIVINPSLRLKSGLVMRSPPTRTSRSVTVGWALPTIYVSGFCDAIDTCADLLST
ncbi:hypothetical protein [Chamaesiphon sp. OTE_20_metabat_361]|uniref:hypothetical protein n=1 Tax=Chamaesiphon sp. OTE_20_metabat_361 TaxID=2964689 RepID=UPI00286AF5FC|nr:hypothetical protein [Chamaesiphon sp. OTE_20_metabat_361]